MSSDSDISTSALNQHEGKSDQVSEVTPAGSVV
jgi:hypothetical protein